MAIKGSDSTSGGFKLYTGITAFEVLGINPTKSQAEAMGITLKEEPEYLKTLENGTKQIRVDFYLLNKEKNIRTKASYFVSDEGRVSKDGKKFEFIDKHGKSSWASDIDALPAFVDKTSAKKSKNGEVELTQFIASWAGVKKDGEARLDNISALFSGNTEEIKAVKKSFPNNKVVVALGVRDGKYQTVYTKTVLQGWATDHKYLVKNLTEDAAAMTKVDFGPSPYELKEWVLNEKPDAEVPTAQSVDKKEDLPF
jgi:hypothetical protein